MPRPNGAPKLHRPQVANLGDMKGGEKASKRDSFACSHVVPDDREQDSCQRCLDGELMYFGQELVEGQIVNFTANIVHVPIENDLAQTHA